MRRFAYRSSLRATGKGTGQSFAVAEPRSAGIASKVDECAGRSPASALLSPGLTLNSAVYGAAGLSRPVGTCAWSPPSATGRAVSVHANHHLDDDNLGSADLWKLPCR